MTNNHAPMKPFYVRVDEKGRVKIDGIIHQEEYSENVVEILSLAYPSHRIVHIAGESASGAEQMRTEIIAWLEGQAARAKQAGEGQTITKVGQEQFAIFCAVKDAIRAIKEIPLPAAPNTDVPPVANAQSALVDELLALSIHLGGKPRIAGQYASTKIDAILSKFGESK